MYDIMRSNFANGLKDEDLIAAILKQVLQGMCYFHQCLHIHRCACLVANHVHVALFF